MLDRMWWETNYTYIWIYNVGRGLSVFIRLPHNVGIIYDLGRSDDFSPTDFFSKKIIPHLGKYEEYNNNKIAQCIISHPHADHIQEIDTILESRIYPFLLTCPNDKEEDSSLSINIKRIENQDNKELIEKYRQSYLNRQPPLRTIETIRNFYVPNLEYGIYYLSPGRVGQIYCEDDHLYVNGLSIVLYLRHGNQSILIPGDITPDVFKEVIDGSVNVQKRYTWFSKVPTEESRKLSQENGNQPTLRSLLNERGLSVLITPHHGLQSCFCPYLFEVIKDKKPLINIISEKRHISEQDGSVANEYQSSDYAKGLDVDIDGKNEKCFSVSTRSGHHILVVFKGTNALPNIFLRTNPDELLNIVP